MTNNVDEPLPIVIDKANSFSCNSYARGYHAYMKIWNLVDGAVLVCKRETDNPHDTTLFPSFVIHMFQAYGVSIIRNSDVVGHVSLRLSKTFSKFLSLPVSTILCIVTRKRLNRRTGLGLEILVMYQVRGHEKVLQWLEKTITKIVLHADDLGSKFKSK